MIVQTGGANRNHDAIGLWRFNSEARGETGLAAIDYCERTVAWMNAQPEDFDSESREPCVEDIARQRALLNGACRASRAMG